MQNKRGQVTLFIIIAVVIIAVVVLFLMLRKPATPGAPIVPFEPKTYVRDCINVNLEPLIENISNQGGYLNPKPALIYNSLPIGYLCYTMETGSCAIQYQPPLQSFIENQLTQEVNSIASSCIKSFETQATKRGYTTQACANPSTKVTIIPKEINTEINCSITLTKGEQTTSFEKFEFSLDSPLYDQIWLANDIVSYEISFDTFPNNHPKYQYVAINWSGSDKIYNITMQDKSFVFAIRNGLI
jgi:hypothetical protein